MRLAPPQLRRRQLDELRLTIRKSQSPTLGARRGLSEFLLGDEQCRSN